jgi:hypothetical protein
VVESASGLDRPVDELTGGILGELEIVRVRAEQPGTARITCAIGPASATAVIRFP